MCGIVGYIGTGQRDATSTILNSLRKLEYRGYDSAGIAVLENGGIGVRRSLGKLCDLELVLEREPLRGCVGIGHTRWATHGRPSTVNAHPHRAGQTVVVHNGIIENYRTLRERLLARGTHLLSETDSEIVAHLVDGKVREGASLVEAVQETVREMEGSYALVFLNQREPERLVIAKKSAPIVIGPGRDEMVVASDIPALIDYTRDVTFLEDGEIAELRADGFRILNGSLGGVDRPLKRVTWDALAAQKGGYPHFMLKEIHEQPQAVADTMRGRLPLEALACSLGEIGFSADTLAAIKRVYLIACGTSWHAALVGKFLIEELAHIPVEVDYASEFRYRDPLIDESSLLIVVSQSGETADTLAALETGREKGARILSICNVVDSTIARKSDGVLYTHAGPEIGVASTKAFTTQLTTLYLLALGLRKKDEPFTPSVDLTLVEETSRLPLLIEEALALEPQIEAMTRELSTARDFLYLGRGINYPIALEGALKLKEIAYIHAEGYPAGEMKHGPIALIDESVPVVVLLPKDRYYSKTLGNLKEVQSRGGIPIVITDEPDDCAIEQNEHRLVVPQASYHLMPILLTIPLQLIAYYTAVHRGTDVDQPRNLAKSVTVE